MQGLIADIEATLVAALDELELQPPGTPARAAAALRVEELEQLLADARSAVKIGVEGEVRPYRAALTAILEDGGRLASGST